jgi:hypothetical protein
LEFSATGAKEHLPLPSWFRRVVLNTMLSFMVLDHKMALANS